jgi:hypothetical protein
MTALYYEITKFRSLEQTLNLHILLKFLDIRGGKYKHLCYLEYGDV